MRLSQLFTKTRKDAPSDETAINAKLLIRAGYIYKVMAGVYAYTPLGLIVLENIKQIVRDEMNAVGGQELVMSSLQRKETWEATNRWDDEQVDVWFKSNLKDGTQVGFGWSHEEAVIEMLKQFVVSYKDLPVNVYQFQNKLRNELRAKSGVMRGREFIMKDMYSCSIDEKQHDDFYDGVISAYHKVFERLGIGNDTYLTFASGGQFTKYSHEFQTVCEAGEDTVHLHRGKKIAINSEVLNDETLNEVGVKRDDLEMVKTAEVGNIFKFGTTKSEETNFYFTDGDGKQSPVHLGSYGIGISRLMGVLVEKFADNRGLVWPESVSPARIILVSIGADSEVTDSADALYEEIKSKGICVLYDDRDMRAGEKLADSELLGIPHRVVVSQKRIADNTIEYTNRGDGVTKTLTKEELFANMA